jgi:hypothetical protein
MLAFTAVQAAGRIGTSFTVPGSCSARTELADKFDVNLPSEFPTTMMRTVLIFVHSTKHAAATSFFVIYSRQRIH